MLTVRGRRLRWAVIGVAVCALGGTSVLSVASSDSQGVQVTRVNSSHSVATDPALLSTAQRALLASVLSDLPGGASLTESEVSSTTISAQSAASAAIAYFGESSALGASLLTISSSGELNGNYWVVAMDATNVTQNGQPAMVNDQASSDLLLYRYAFIDSEKGTVVLGMEGGRPS